MKPIYNFIIICALLLGGVIIYNKYSGTKDSMEQYIEKYNTFKENANNANKMADSLKTIIAIEQNEANAAQSRANIYAKQAKTAREQLMELRTAEDSARSTITDSTEMARIIIPRLDAIIAKQDTVIKHQEGEIGQLRLTLHKKDTVIFLLTMSRDSLQRVVINMPPPPKNPNKMFGITLPSRTVSFIAGALLAGVTTTLLSPQ